MTKLFKKIAVSLALFIPALCHGATQVYIPSTGTFHSYIINVATITSLSLNSSTMTIGASGAVGAAPVLVRQDKAANTSVVVENESTSSSGGAQVVVKTNPAGANPSYQWITGTTWHMGTKNQNTTTDSLYIGTSTVVGSSTAVRMDTTGLVTLTSLALTNALSLSTGTISVFNSTSVTTTDLNVKGNITSTITVNGGANFLNKIFVSTSSAIGAAFSVTATSCSIDVPTSIRGTQTNGNAVSGYVGETITSLGNTANIASNAWVDVSTLALTAGDWNITGLMSIAPQTVNPVFSRVQLGISSTAGNSATGLVEGDSLVDCYLPTSASNKGGCTIPNYRASLSAATTYYIKANAVWTTDNVRFNGRGSATRIR